MTQAIQTATITPKPADERPRIDALTSLRFFAAACIVAHHMRGSFGIPPDSYLHINLASGVSFFFVLSGYVLSYAHRSLGSGSETVHFVIRRWFRIWPLHFACLVILICLLPNLLTGSSSGTGLLILLSNLLLLEAWIPVSNFYFSYNPVAWSISVEWFFYLCFPLLLLCFTIRKVGLILPLLLSLAFLAASVVIGPNYPGYTGQNNLVTSHGILYIGPLARILEFVMGMYTFKLSAQFPLRLSWIPATALQFGASALAVLSLMPVLAGPCARLMPVALREWYGYSGNLLVWALLIYSMTLGSGLIGKALSHRVLVFLGEISFAIYLVHFPIAHIIALRCIGNAAATHWQISGYLLIVLSAATILYFAVEIPCMRIGKFIGRNCISPRASNSHQLMICPFVPANRVVGRKGEAE
jgi:peptidoglycan/LPS O-acetylase OafA/YrhL